MPNLTSFIKPSKKATSSNKSRKATSRTKNANLLSVDAHPGLSRDKSAHMGFFFRQKNGNHPTISKTISQSRIMSTSSASVSSSDSTFPNTRLLIPKCNTVANFEQSQDSSANLRTKYNSEISFGPLRRATSSFSAGLASLGLTRAASVVSNLSFIKSRANSSTSVSLELELCRLCLCDMPPTQMVQLKHCRCKFCFYCLQQYVMFQIVDGNVQVTCPDAHCEKDGILTLDEIESLVDAQLFEKYMRYQLNYEVDLDPNRTWCPRVNCETICDVTNASGSTICPKCAFDFCWKCKLECHDAQTCDGYARKKFKNSTYDESLILADEENASIKRCPLCRVPIERDEGCAQMMCKRCKHVFCWYCLASLDDDFLLRHYDKGPCKNKLGHSRASVFWHRTQVVGIFAGFGLLLLVASPFLLLVAPCILCSSCKGGCGASCSKDEESKITLAVPTSI